MYAFRVTECFLLFRFTFFKLTHDIWKEDPMENHKPWVSIGLPVHNGEKYLEITLKAKSCLRRIQILNWSSQTMPQLTEHRKFVLPMQTKTEESVTIVTQMVVFNYKCRCSSFVVPYGRTYCQYFTWVQTLYISDDICTRTPTLWPCSCSSEHPDRDWRLQTTSAHQCGTLAIQIGIYHITGWAWLFSTRGYFGQYRCIIGRICHRTVLCSPSLFQISHFPNKETLGLCYTTFIV